MILSYDAALEKLCKNNTIKYIAMQDILQKADFIDGLHPNHNGHKKICNYIFVEDLIVDKDYRNKGVGKDLLQNVVNYAKTNDCEVVELTSYIQNVDAHKKIFYP